jgi:predicted amidophosphoribosyltransferase
MADVKMVHCPHCVERIAQLSKVCPYCGRDLKHVQGLNQPQPLNITGLLFWVVVAVAVILLAIVLAE